jgi:uncharacterized Zn finger protein
MGERFRATVRGSVPYTVELWDDGGRPGWSCTCPYAEDGAFCKHGVAVALLLDAGAPPDALPADLQGPVDEPRDDADGLLVEHLDGLDRDRLVALVLEAADQDWRLRERLLADARAARGEGPALAAWRRRVDAAFSPYDEFVSYREAAGWAGEVDEVIDALAELCDAGHPEAAAVLAEHAHRRADDAIGYVDDSDGWLMDISERLAEVHLHACIEGAPDPVELAGRLVALELSSELDGFHRAAATYAGVLGHDGLAAYRRSLAPRWDEVRSQSEGWSSQRFRLREAMIGVAIASGDPDELIAIYRDDLRTPDGYLEIARTLRAAGRDAEAEAWARDGLAAFSGRSWQTPPLREFLAGLLRERGERSAAVELFWEAFLQAPSLTAYRRLVDEASEDAPAVKTRALEALSSRVERPADGDARGCLRTVRRAGRDPGLRGRNGASLAGRNRARVRSPAVAHPGTIPRGLPSAGCDRRVRAGGLRAHRDEEERRLWAGGRPAQPHPAAGSTGRPAATLRGRPAACSGRARTQTQPDEADRPEGR